ncbi:unnamed protein product, partial [marine sediment metagenome]
GKGQKVLIEEAKITVCQSCAQYGKKIRNEPKISYSQQQTYVKLKRPVKKFVPRRNGDENIEMFLIILLAANKLNVKNPLVGLKFNKSFSS